MPIYEFFCKPCNYVVEDLRQLNDHTPPECPKCDDDMQFIVSASNMHVWVTDRFFPNVSKYGDGSQSFETKDAYRQHLKDNHMVEVSTSARNKTTAGAEVTVYE